MKTPRFEGPFKWRALRQQLLSLREDVQSIEKIAGRHVTIDEHRGKGKVVNVASDASRRPSGGGAATGACCVGTDCSIQTADDCAGMGGTYQGDDTTCDPNPCVDCTICDDLPPSTPGGPPTHINIRRTLSGTCGTGTLSGTVEYDLDLGFGSVGPISGHNFCAHSIFDNGFGAFWTGHFYCNGSLFYEHGDGSTQGFGGLLGRDKTDCTWWLEVDAFLPTSCGGCGLGFATIFEMISGPGDPSGVYNFSETLPGGFTMDTVVTIT